MSEQSYFEQFTGEDIPEIQLVITFTPEQTAQFVAEWEAYKEANPDWWHQENRWIVCE